jgi:predicted ATP-grasp superfamily ATP-dependent carboligase
MAHTTKKNQGELKHGNVRTSKKKEKGRYLNSIKQARKQGWWQYKDSSAGVILSIFF